MIELGQIRVSERTLGVDKTVHEGPRLTLELSNGAKYALAVTLDELAEGGEALNITCIDGGEFVLKPRMSNSVVLIKVEEI